MLWRFYCWRIIVFVERETGLLSLSISLGLASSVVVMIYVYAVDGLLGEYPLCIYTRRIHVYQFILILAVRTNTAVKRGQK